MPFRIAAAIGPGADRESLPSALLDRAPTNEVVEPDVDLSRLPVPVHALLDGGRYLDSSVVVARNSRDRGAEHPDPPDDDHRARPPELPSSTRGATSASSSTPPSGAARCRR